MRARLGWLGPAVVLVGLAVGGVGVWWMARSRPVAGAYVDVVAVAARGAVAVRAEQGGPRGFVELIELGPNPGGRWKALIPTYGGGDAPGVTVTQRVVNVRVVRDGRAEVFTLALADAIKVGGARLTEAWPPAPGGYGVPGVVSVDGAFHAYDVVGGAAGYAVIATSRTDGTPAWRHEAARPIAAAFELGTHLVLAAPDGALTLLDARTGARDEAATAARATARWTAPAAGDLAPPDQLAAAALGDEAARVALAAAPRLRFDAATRTLTIDGGAPRPWPAGAATPRPHHLGAGVLWLVWPERVVAVDARTLASLWSSDGAPFAWP